MELLKGDVAPFVRIEATVSKTQLGIESVRTFIGELHMVQSQLTPISEVRMGLGYDGLVFMGRGSYKLVPTGFGLDIFLGGVSDRGIMLGIDVYLPAPIPLEFADALAPADEIVGIEHYDVRVRFGGMRGAIGNVVQALVVPSIPEAPPAFSVEFLGVDFCDRTVLASGAAKSGGSSDLWHAEEDGWRLQVRIHTGRTRSCRCMGRSGAP
jgi:hypothetical protein